MGVLVTDRLVRPVYLCSVAGWMSTGCPHGRLGPFILPDPVFSVPACLIGEVGQGTLMIWSAPPFGGGKA